MTSRDDDTLADERLLETVPHPRRSGDVTHVRVIGPTVKYTFGPVLGKGGMGEVVLAQDREIGREIAFKRLHTAEPSADEVRRFLREAKIQALLDHPAIVPVHEVGEDDDGRPYFTMKRLVGVTLAELLAKDTPRQRLLRAITEVALAVERAHSLGVTHRDLKPANIMLGDFGEVYVLDWGLARVASDPDHVEPHGRVDAGDGTLDGVMLGTPGYMSPEQVEDARSVDDKTDIYALGSILFEILAGEPLHPRGHGAIASTLADIDPSPAHRRPDRSIPPELDALCIAALARRPAARPSARAFADGIQAYLDGDRDLARRHEMAGEYLATARTQLARDDRAEAMRFAGRALALDPSCAAAADIVTRLMLEPPKDPPAPLRAELEEIDARDVKRHASFSALAYFLVLVLVPIAAWNGIRDWTVVWSVTALGMVLSGLSWLVYRRPKQPAWLWVYAVGNAVFLALLNGLSGPLLVVPALTCVIAMGLASYPTLSRHLLAVIGLAFLGCLAPGLLQVANVLPTSWHIANGTLVIHEQAVAIVGPFTVGLVVLISLMTIAIAAGLTGAVTRAHHEAKRRLVTQAWHLRQLLPAT